MSLLSRVTDLLTEQNTTIKQAERDCGLSNGSIRRWNVSSPSADNLVKIADYLKASIDYLLEDDRKFTITQKEINLSADELILTTLFNKLDCRDKAEIIDIIKLKYERACAQSKKNSSTEKSSMLPYAIAGRDGTRLTGLISQEDADALNALPESYPGE